MLRSLKKLVLLPILLVAVTACEPGETTGGALPTAPDPLLGGLLGGNSVQGYTLVRDPLLPGILKSVSTGSLIGFNGGQISLLGHTVTVPVGAVSKPTLFSLIVLPTGYVEVDLTATLTSILGPFDVGAAGFNELVPVSLSYARATNVSDPSHLKVLRIKSLIGYGKYEVMPTTVNTAAETANTQLDHFSRYTLAFPD
jgi:hypothetical protein